MEAELTLAFERRIGDGVVAIDERLPLAPGRITVLFGPSGAGKTTVLRAIAGLERIDAGHIAWNDEVWSDAARDRHVPPHTRRVGLVFQDDALFPHLDVRGNVAYGLRGTPRAERRARAEHLLARTGCADLARRRPAGLSGGERRRVALARALAPRPRLLLLDEPFSALDEGARIALRRDLVQLLGEEGVPALLVTHERDEALFLGERIVVVVDGRVRLSGDMQQVFGRPRDLEAARALGVDTLVTGRVLSVREGLVRVAVGSAELLVVAPEEPASEVFVAVRAEDVALARPASGAGASSPRNRLDGVVRSIEPEGWLLRVTIDCGFPLAALVTRPAAEELGLAPGGRVQAVVKTTALHLVPKPAGGRDGTPPSAGR